MTVFLIYENEQRYVANSTGVILFAKNKHDIPVKDIDELDVAISELSEFGVEVEEVDFDTEPINQI